MVKFKREFLTDELELPSTKKCVLKEIVGHSRWSVVYRIIFEYQSKFYENFYSVGATEQQDEGPWEYEEEVECMEVHQVEKLKKVWELVASEATV